MSTCSPTRCPALSRLARLTLSSGSAALLAAALASCSDEPTRPAVHTPSAAPQANVAATSAPLSFRQISAGDLNTCGVTTSNVAYCWGDNQFGQLGNGATDGRIHPTPTRVLGGLSFREISVGERTVCGVTTNNVGYCWGRNHNGQLGNGTSDNNLHPRPVRVAGGLSLRQVSITGDVACALTLSNAVYCWGRNQLGQLGVGNNTGPEGCVEEDPDTGEPIPCSTRPVRVLGGLTFRQLNAGDSHICGVTTNNVAYCWGANAFGELGIGTTTGNGTCSDPRGIFPCFPRPVRVVGGHAFSQVGTGQNHTCGVTTSGVAYCWGSNEFGGLGIGNNTGPEICDVTDVNESAPCSTRPVRVLGGLTLQRVHLGVWYTCGLTAGDAAYCWGDNRFGQLGVGTFTGPQDCGQPGLPHPCSTRPRRVAGGLAFQALGVGFGHACGITTASRAYCWGSNFEGELGDGTNVFRARPVAVVGP